MSSRLGSSSSTTRIGCSENSSRIRRAMLSRSSRERAICDEGAAFPDLEREAVPCGRGRLAPGRVDELEDAGADALGRVEDASDAALADGVAARRREHVAHDLVLELQRVGGEVPRLEADLAELVAHGQTGRDHEPDAGD